MTDSLQSVEDILRTEPEASVLTMGCSMQPMLRQHRDVVIIEKITRPLKRNDVVLYRAYGLDKLILHRILKVKRDGSYVIRGDNTYFKECGITDKNMVGILKAFYRDGKYCDVNTSKKYKLYVFFMRITYVPRFLWKIKIRPFLSKIKHSLF